MDDLRALASDLRASGMALCVDLVLNHVAAEHPWARDPAFLRTFPDRDGARRVRAHAARTCSPTPRPGLHAGPRSTVWVWTTFNAYQWDLDYTNPDVFVAMAEAMLGLARGRRRRAAPGRRAVPVEAARARTARTSPRSTSCCRPSARRCGSPRPRSPSRPRRSSRRATSSPTSGPAARGQGVRPRLPQRARWCCCGARWRRGRVALMTSHAAGDAARPARRRLADLRALPRRHRLGDHARGRRAGRRGRLPAPALPGRLLRGRVPGHVRARRALPARPAHRRGAHVRHAARRWPGWRARRTRSRSSSRSGASCCCTRSPSRTAGCR